MARHKDGLGVGRGKLGARGGRAGLEEEGDALRGGVDEVFGVEREVLALVVDGAHLRGVNVAVGGRVRGQGRVGPGGFPELVEHAEVFVRLAVALIVLDGVVEADGFEGRLFPRRDNVPADAAVGEVVEGGEALGEEVGRFERGGGGDGEGEVLGDGGHGRDGDGGVCHGPLGGAADALVDAVLVCVVAAVGVGQEEGVDAAAFEELGELDPVREFAFCCGFVGWVLRC